VQEACDEFKLPPEETPTVQLIMVIKELLVQRKLNEPFSGGLSSYSVSLMICAAIREAKALRQELVAVAKEPQQRCEAPQALPSGTSNFEDLKSYSDVINLPVQEVIKQEFMYNSKMKGSVIKPMISFEKECKIRMNKQVQHACRITMDTTRTEEAIKHRKARSSRKSDKWKQFFHW
jgi:hypothetical protein